jgi:poly(A) polymerase
MSREKAAAPFGAEPAGVLDLATAVAGGMALPDPAITDAVRGVAPQLVSLPAGQLRHTLEKVIMGKALGAGLQWMHDAGVLAAVLPELDATVDFSQEAGRRHKDVWEHTKQVVLQSVPSPIVRWAALLHDIGKVRTRVMLPDGKVTFHRHAEVGARMWEPIARRLAFDKQERGQIRFLILHHLRANAYEPSWTDAAVRRFDHEMGDHLDALLELSCADVTSRRPGRREEAIRNIEALRDRIVAIRTLDARVPPLPPGLGNAIMETFSIPPSKRIGELRKQCEDAIERGELEERREADYYIAYLRKLI